MSQSLSLMQRSQAKHLAERVASIDTYARRMEVLLAEPTDKVRNVVGFKRLLRVSPKHVENNEQLLSMFIRERDDDLLGSTPFMTYVWQLLGDAKDNSLSSQSSRQDQHHWQRWEADRCRLL